jgi:hypothetical protein
MSRIAEIAIYLAVPAAGWVPRAVSRLSAGGARGEESHCGLSILAYPGRWMSGRVCGQAVPWNGPEDR